MDILSIAPATGTVSIGNGQIDVYGVSLRFWVSLIAKCPDVVNIFDGKTMEISKLLAASPDAALALMAKGCRVTGNAPAEAVLDELPLDDQIDIIKEIVRLSGERNYRPFVAGLSQLGLKLSMNGAAVEEVPEISSESLP